MMPTFNPRGDVALLEHVSVWTHRIRVGDVVVAKSMSNPRHVVCKRVLGLAGDTVTIPSSSKYGMGRTVVIPKGQVWLQGGEGGGGQREALGPAGGWLQGGGVGGADGRAGLMWLAARWGGQMEALG